MPGSDSELFVVDVDFPFFGVFLIGVGSFV